MTTRRLDRTHLLGVAGLALILAFVSVTVGTYRHWFSNAALVTIDAPRAGLLLDPGADVRLHGVSVGEVRAIHAAGTRARITVALDPHRMTLIPHDVTAQIVPASTFGGKMVSLVAPATEAAETKGGAPVAALRAGQTVKASAVTPEIDDLFAQTKALLDAVPVDKLDVVLTTLAHTLDGRGQQIGTFLTTLDHYLTQLNASGGALTDDLKVAPAVLRSYADVTPALLGLLQHSTVTAKTVTARASDVQTLLTSFSTLAARGTGLVNSAGPYLTHALADFTPLTQLLAKYSPEYPCTLEGWSSMATNNESLGVKYPGAQVVMTLLPGQDGYTYPRDLPQYVDNRGPECYGLPDLTDKKPPRRNLNDGEHAYDNQTDTVTLGNPIAQFFASKNDPNPVASPTAAPSGGSSK